MCQGRGEEDALELATHVDVVAALQHVTENLPGQAQDTPHHL